jgi:alpha-L-rhamnosidase
MLAWVEYMEEQAGDTYLWTTGGHFGDWLSFNPGDPGGSGAITDKDLIATAFFAHSTSNVIDAARVLDKSEDVARYTELLDRIKEAFRKEYVTPNGRMASNTQTAYLLALMFDLLPEGNRPDAARRLAEDIRRRGNHLSTGFVGTPYLCHVLTRFGYVDVAYDLLNQETYPSWLYPVKMGATTIWERWDGIRPNGTFQDAGMNSFNHYAYGAIGDWLYRVVAGINPDSEAPGYKHFLIEPSPGGGLSTVKASLASMYGQISSSWRLEGGCFTISITVPPNSGATVRLPSAELEKILESGHSLAEAEGIRSKHQDGDMAVIEVGSGGYVFSYDFRR